VVCRSNGYRPNQRQNAPAAPRTREIEVIVVDELDPSRLPNSWELRYLGGRGLGMKRIMFTELDQSPLVLDKIKM